MSLRSFLASFPLVLALSASAAAQGQVFVVDDDPGPGVDFTDIQAAVDQAQDGDLVLVRDGGYGPVQIAGKAVSVVAHAQSPPVVSAPLRVSSLPAGKTVVVRGLEIQIPLLQNVTGLAIEGCQGVVAVEDVEVVANPFWFGMETPAVHVTNCARVSLTRVKGTGARGVNGTIFQPGSEVPGGPGLRADGSTVAAYECVFEGGEGPTGGGFNATSAPGGPGVRLENQSFLFAHGSVLRGGKGGDANPFVNGGCAQAQPGGDGVAGVGGVELLDTQALGGPGGAASPGCSPQAPDGQPIDVTGTVRVLAEAARGYRASSPAFVGQTVDHEFLGLPGDFAVLFVSLQAGMLDGGGIPGFLLPAPPFLALPIGAIPPSGSLVVSVTVPPALPPGVGNLPFFEQFGVAGSTGTGFLSSPSVVHVVP